MPWRWNPKKNHYQQIDSLQSTSASAQSEAPETWKLNKNIEDDGFITVHPNLNPPFEPMEVEEGSITFPSEK